MNNHRYSSFFNNPKGILVLMAWMTVVPWVSTLVITYLALNQEEWIRGFTLVPWVCFFGASVLSMGLAITPTTFICLLCGYFLGLQAILPVILCYQLASLVGFGLAQKMDNHTLIWVKQKFPKSAPIFANLEQQQWLTTLLARISPALPFGLMNVVLAVSGVRLVPFFFGGLFGMLPRTVFFIWLGTQAPALIEALQTKDQLVWFIVLSVTGLWLLYKLLRPKRQKTDLT
ncbi:VTT domain-containing protein [Reichenbachiella carrageenanivorans]|uniref:TVP38/TMEM64 family membrane protein n=1 Tax=Reichenbachiella carrageenanivorans TaxID=2979869 RepID=A0ABY6D2C0_9BACT|nr:VTT domain-containing protein [Reichenbachiella carrageenanivorans]UXX80306.1 VTT domain-containing protein [Reichenbachiella carrageenanivorans]